jgi:hypothetical protein
LLVGLLSSRRGVVLTSYAALLTAATARACRRDPVAAPQFALTLPTMHLAWAVGFLQGFVSPQEWPVPNR